MKKPNSILIFVFILAARLAYGQGAVDAFDRYAEAARKEWNVPGMSLVVVQDGKVLLAKGYGVRELGKNEAVGPDTLFGAMSTTKAMTAVTMAMLVDEGKVAWDDKVIKHLPDFRVADPYITAELRIRDLFTHNGGMGNTDFLWAWTPELPVAEVVKRMQLARPTYPFRGGYNYQNVMYMIAGQVIAKVSGMSWERFVTDRLFSPLGMNNTFANIELSKNYANRSTAHYVIENKVTPIPEMVADSIAPAGAVWSTADDIGKWVAFMLGDGTANGRILLRPATFQTLTRPQIIVPPGQFYPTVALTKPHWTSYALGWFQHDYRGEMVNFHTGSLAGRTAIIGLIPDKKMGIYVFGNVDHAEVRHALMYKAFDMFAFGDNNGRDWSKEMKTLYDGIDEQGRRAAAAALARRLPNTKPSQPLTNYVGKYSDPFYGDIDVTLVEGKLRLAISKQRAAALEHWHNETFQVKWDQRWLGESFMSFQLNAITGEVESMNFGGAQFRRAPRGN
jgi:CubicO group peptidase (beta-lactamase class C family)